jgi:3-carboxy-cis,cis-muconate cycloisomerase
VSDVLWPGDERAGTVFTDSAVLTAMVRVEAAWLGVLTDADIAPAAAVVSLAGLVTDADLTSICADAEAGGNPVIPLVELLRSRLDDRGDVEAARWLHRGLTSQDVLDTALMCCLRDALEVIHGALGRQVAALIALVVAHRTTLMAGRTLTQHAVPVTFGAKAAGWLDGILDAAEDLGGVGAALPVQAGGAAGTGAAVAELADSPLAVETAGAALASRLGLSASPPWHTRRRPVTRAGDALVALDDALGHIANDVLLLARPEIGELAEGSSGGSSTMPQKQNPVLATLVRRTALTAPLLGAQLHAAAAAMVDERSAGAWHAEWAALRALARITLVAAEQAADLLGGLVVHDEVMRARARTASAELLAERDAVHALRPGAHADPGDRAAGSDAELAGYLGAADLLIGATLERAARFGRGEQ